MNEQRYHFDARPDDTWVFYLPDNKRLMGRGYPFTDKHLTKFLEGMERGKISKLLEYMLDRYGIKGEPVLMDANKDGFKFVKGDVAVMRDKIGHILQLLVDSCDI